MAPESVTRPFKCESQEAVVGGQSEASQTESGTSKYEFRVQSCRFCDDNDRYDEKDIEALVRRNIDGRITQVGERLAESLFPDAAFGFPINDQFLSNFFGSFLSTAGLLDATNFLTDQTTCVFFNRMISTIDHFLQATNEPDLANLRPLRYFTALHSTKPVSGSTIKRKPDLILVRLIDGRLREGTMQWHDIQALVEQTRETKPPMRMKETVSSKSYQLFCSQPERDFVINLCITGEGFHIVVADHSGMVETDVIKITQYTSPVFVRMVMGLAFLPDEFIGVDKTITRNELGIASDKTFQDFYQPYTYNASRDPITLLRNQRRFSNPLAISRTPVVEGFDKNISTIRIRDTVYRVFSVIFLAKSFIGRATRAFLVQLPNGTMGVLKDSWIPISRLPESAFLEQLAIPFGPEIIDHCILGNTGTVRSHAIASSALDECREKRRIAIYPAGVHIADFSCLWELMAACLDIVIGKILFLCYFS
jgi:Fungal protein kinase